MRSTRSRSTFGSSLDIADRSHVLVNKVGHIVPFDTCAVYLYDDGKTTRPSRTSPAATRSFCATACVAPGEGVIGFVARQPPPRRRL